MGDVTSIVKSKIDAAPPGRVDLTITESPAYETDGELLVVIFNDPSQTTDNTIVLMFGAQKTDGDDFNIGLAEPLDLTDPNLALDFSLASSYSYQENLQYSIVEVNGVRMTSWAGGNDYGITDAANGNLFTVGGLDDSTANPADPYATPSGDKRYDDELYTLIPFVKTGDTQIKVHTQNPSNDDNVFFAGLFIRSATAVVGQGILLSPASATNPLNTKHTVTATVQDDDGKPVVGKIVTFTITAGPHAPATGTATTGADGKAQFTYTGTIVGTDTLIASFVDDSGKTLTSNEVTKTWKDDGPIPTPEFPTIALPMALIIGMLGAVLFIQSTKKN